MIKTKPMRKNTLFLMMITTLSLISCSKGGDDSPADPCNGTTKTFSVDVNPIIQSVCNQPSCHNPGSTNGPGSLTNYNEVFSARSAIRPAIASGLMPQNTTLTTTQKNAILCWIDSGAPNN